jgi:hypothetical protein
VEYRSNWRDEWRDGPADQRLVYRDEGQREYAYGPAGGLPDNSVGTFFEALMTEGKAPGWTVISIKNDWRRVVAFE